MVPVLWPVKVTVVGYVRVVLSSVLVSIQVGTGWHRIRPEVREHLPKADPGQT